MLLLWILSVSASGGDRLLKVNQPVWRNRATAGQELARVVEDDNAVAQQAPPLLGAEGDGAGRVMVGAVSGGHGADAGKLLASGMADVLDCGTLVLPGAG